MKGQRRIATCHSPLHSTRPYVIYQTFSDWNLRESGLSLPGRRLVVLTCLSPVSISAL